MGFHELFVGWWCSSLHAWMHSLSTEKMISLKMRGDHGIETAGSKRPPPQHLPLLLGKRVFPAMCLHFLCGSWLHLCPSVRNETCIPLTSKIVGHDKSWMEEFCFSNYWHCLPGLFRSQNSFSDSFSLRLCIPLPKLAPRSWGTNFWALFILSLVSDGKACACPVWQSLHKLRAASSLLETASEPNATDSKSSNNDSILFFRVLRT